MERAREEVSILLNEVWHRAVINFGCVSPRIHWIKFKFSRVKVCVVVGYGPNEERDRFWNDMDRAMDRPGNRYKLCILRDLYRWIDDRTRNGITSAFGVPGENDKGRRVVEICTEGGMRVSNIF